MEKTRLLTLLEETAHRFGIDVRYERLDGEDVPIHDGFCRIREQKVLLVDKRHSVNEKIRILIEALGKFESDDLYIPPVIRELMEKAGVRQPG